MKNGTDKEVKCTEPRTLIVFCAGSGYNLDKGSLIERWYSGFKADELSIRPTLAETESKTDTDIDDKGLPSELVRISHLEAKERRIDKLYLAGPGSASYGEIKTPGHESPVLGIPKSEIEGKFNSQTPFSRGFYRGEEVQVDADSAISRNLRGTAFGGGYKDNVMKAATTVANALGSDHEYKKVILVGYSRGGVTAQNIAYQLHEMGITTPVDIFSIDPVEGSKNGLLDEATRTIGSNVKSMDVILATGDETKEFHPQGPERQIVLSKETEINYYLVAGTHSQVAGAPIENPDNCDCASAQVVTGLFMNFLNRSFGEGHNLLPDPGLTSQQIVSSYAYMQTNPEEFKYVLDPIKNPLDGIYTKAPRPFLLNPSILGKSDSFFMNRHHQDHFEKIHPGIFSKIEDKTVTFEDIVSAPKTSKLQMCHLTHISLVMSFILQPLHLEIDQLLVKLSEQQYSCQDLREELLNLKESARKAIFNHIHGKETNSPEWQEKNLYKLPEVDICNNAVTMVKIIIDTRRKITIDDKRKAISQFNENSRKLAGKSNLSQSVGKIVSGAVKLLGAIVSAAASIFVADTYFIDKRTERFSRKACGFFADNRLTQHARKFVNQKEKTTLGY